MYDVFAPNAPARRAAPRLRTVASREEAPPAPAPAARERAPDRRSSAQPPYPAYSVDSETTIIRNPRSLEET